MKNHQANVWLVNTGWSGGGYGTGSRMKLSVTRRIIDAIHSGELAKAPTKKDETFGFDVVTECPEVPSNILIPKNTWKDGAAYDAAAQKLAKLFVNNFKTYEGGVSAEVRAASPVVK
jgi:phosphoenolpyruvate carboxykinase (ATP)